MEGCIYEACTCYIGGHNHVGLPAGGLRSGHGRSLPAAQPAAVLAECISLLGMDDAESAGALGGSEQNIAADGETLIGRIYSAELFGESVEPGTTYGDDGRVNSVSIYLAGTDAAVYAEVLTRLYGEPVGESDGVSESGSTWQDWTVEGARVRLYQSYGLTSLEITTA